MRRQPAGGAGPGAGARCALCGAVGGGGGGGGLALRSLAAFYYTALLRDSAAMPENVHYSWVCHYCWARAKQCIRFIECVRQAEAALNSALKNEDVVTEEFSRPLYTVNHLGAYNICDFDECEPSQFEMFTHGGMDSASDHDTFSDFPDFNDLQSEIVIKTDPDIIPFVDFLKVKDKLQPEVKAVPKRPKRAVKKQQKANSKTPFVPSREALDKIEADKLKKMEMELVLLSKEQQLKELKTRQQSAKYVNSKFKCEKCVFSSNEEETYENHKSKHDVSSGPYACDICWYYFSEPRPLKVHTRAHARRWRCLRCNVIVLERHQVPSHHEICSNAGGVQCTECGKNFPSNHRLKIHINIAHRKAKRLTCDHCGQMFKYKFELRNHVRRHTGDAPYECDLCGKRSKTSGLHKTHLKSHEARVKKEEGYCVECDRYYKSALHLRAHLASSLVHNPKNTFRHTCNMCPDGFPCASQLQIHMNTVHLKRRTHPCTQCDKAYYTKGALKIHVRNKHSQQVRTREHVCATCGKAFLAKPSLQNHILAIHEKERPFACQWCPATFGFKAALFTHNKLKHKVKPQPRE